MLASLLSVGEMQAARVLGVCSVRQRLSPNFFFYRGDFCPMHAVSLAGCTVFEGVLGVWRQRARPGRVVAPGDDASTALGFGCPVG